MCIEMISFESQSESIHPGTCRLRELSATERFENSPRTSFSNDIDLANPVPKGRPTYILAVRSSVS